MFIRLLILLIFLPILEIYVLVASGRLIGVGATVLLVVLTGIAGSWLMRQQGLEVLRRLQHDLATGQQPTATILDGVLVLLGGILLLTPGFCTDLIGFSMLVPGLRRVWREVMQRWLAKQLASGNLVVHRF